jgi:hypothetical protein
MEMAELWLVSDDNSTVRALAKSADGRKVNIANGRDVCRGADTLVELAPISKQHSTVPWFAVPSSTN